MVPLVAAKRPAYPSDLLGPFAVIDLEPGSTMRKSTLFTSAALLLLPLTASAGGVGFFASGGVHEGRAPYYRDDGLQGIDIQYRPNNAIGFEGLLGDKDDKIQGVVRLFVLNDWPLNAPDVSNENPDYEYTWPAHEDLEIRHQGAVMVGVQWGLIGDPSGFQLTATSLVGSGFATMDNLEFLMVEPGVGVTYAINSRIQANANVAATGRYRKRLYMGANAYAGIRYMFD